LVLTSFGGEGLLGQGSALVSTLVVSSDLVRCTLVELVVVLEEFVVKRILGLPSPTKVRLVGDGFEVLTGAIVL